MEKQDAESLLQEALERGKELPEPFKTYVEATDLKTLQMFNCMDKAPFEQYVGSLNGINVVFLGRFEPRRCNFCGKRLSDRWDLAEQFVNMRSWRMLGRLMTS
jgi:hypothetical protein